MPMFNVPQALLWIANYQVRKFSADDLKARLAYLADRPSVFAVHQMFSKKGNLPEDNTRSDIQESLSAEIADPAEIIFNNSHDDLVQNLFAGRIAMRGRPVQTQACAIPFSVSFGYLLGCAPISHLEVIPAAAFGDLQFKDREGVEAVPLDFPSREFPRWRDLSLSGDDVRRLWPVEADQSGTESKTVADDAAAQVAKPGGRPIGTGYEISDAPIVNQMKMLAAKGKSPTAAAWSIIGRDGKGAEGNGRPESKVARLVARAKNNSE
jgi:hypothetical protein